MQLAAISQRELTESRKLIHDAHILIVPSIMTDPILIRFGMATWFSFMLTNLSIAAMGIELRRRGVPIRWLSYSLNMRVRLEKINEVTAAYWEFKRERGEFPLFACALLTAALGLLVIPFTALLYRLLAS